MAARARRPVRAPKRGGVRAVKRGAVGTKEVAGAGEVADAGEATGAREVADAGEVTGAREVAGSVNRGVIRGVLSGGICAESWRAVIWLLKRNGACEETNFIQKNLEGQNILASLAYYLLSTLNQQA